MYFFGFDQKATVTHSDNAHGWGFAETWDGKTVFLHSSRQKAIRLQGSNLILVPANGQRKIPEKGVEVTFNRLTTSFKTGGHPQADEWVEAKHLETMEKALGKARQTLATLAMEREKNETLRQAAIQASALKHKGGKGQKNGKQKQHA